MSEGPAVPSHPFKCSSCELSINARRCVCGGRGIPLLDRRPVLLTAELQDLVEGSMGEAIAEAQTTEDSTRARLLRQLVIPHFLRVLSDHEQASARRRRGEGGYRELRGSTHDQLRLVSRMPMAGLRPSERRTP